MKGVVILWGRVVYLFGFGVCLFVSFSQKKFWWACIWNQKWVIHTFVFGETACSLAISTAEAYKMDRWATSPKSLAQRVCSAALDILVGSSVSYQEKARPGLRRNMILSWLGFLFCGQAYFRHGLSFSDKRLRKVLQYVLRALLCIAGMWCQC